jgi:ribosome-interacting GTPase 1
VTEHYNRIVKDKDETAFIETANASKEFFWSENTSAGQKYTDKIIYLLGKQIQAIEDNIWKKWEFINIYTKERSQKTIKKFENNYIHFEDWESYNLDEWEMINS